MKEASDEMSSWTWDLSRIFEESEYALVILNQPIKGPKNEIIEVWKKASFRVTADGGTDRWKEFTFGIDVPDPDLICGDFDSVSIATLEYYKSRGHSTVVNTQDQDYTDFTKALFELHERRKDIKNVFALVENSGRLDQILANVETLFRSRDIFGPDSSLYIISPKSISWLLHPGTHLITGISRDVEAYVGLIPIGSPIESVTTSGLVYNVKEAKLAFGHLVSTSNCFDGSGETTIQTSGTMLFYISDFGKFS